MKTYLITLLAFIFSISSFAQSSNDYLELAREVLKAEKKAIIAEAIDLSEDESQAFWNLYNEYQSKLYIIQNKRIATLKNYAENFDALSPEKADQLWNEYINQQGEILKLKKKYYKKFKKIISLKKTVILFQAENKIEIMINAQLAIEIPLVE